MTHPTHQPQSQSKAPELTWTHFAALAGEVVRHIDQADCLSTLRHALLQVADFDNFIVVHYQEKCAAELVESNLDLGELRAQMTPYFNGVHVLDPFYIAGSTGRRGLLTMHEVAPEGFSESEYFRIYYQTVDVVDDARFVIDVAPAQVIQIYMEREPPRGGYVLQEIERLRAIEPFVRSCVQKHWGWRNMSASVRSEDRTPLGQGLRSVIANLGNGVLTAREVDIVDLAIKGHSSKSIAHLLTISEGTVINHKRNLYAKLGINSQSQLFHMFLQALY